MVSSFLSRQLPAPASNEAADDPGSQVPHPYPYQITATPIYRPAPSRPRSSFLSRLLPFRKKAPLHKLGPGKSKEVKSLEQNPVAAVASRPIIGAKGDDAPSVDLRVITPGTWYGRPASLVLLQLNHHGTPAIPLAKVEVHVTPREQGRAEPVIVGAGPYKVIAQERGSTRGIFSAEPIYVSPAGAQGVRFSIRPPLGSQQGITPSVHLAFVYAFEGAVVLEASLEIEGTVRKFTLDRGKNDPIMLPQGQWLSYQKVKCSVCEKENQDQCREFSHADKAFWFNFINQLSPERPNCPSFAQNDNESWFAEFRPQTGASAQASGPRG